MATKKSTKRAKDPAAQQAETRPRPAADAPWLVRLGLVANDGSGEIAFCSSDPNGSPRMMLLDLSTAWEPDGDGDRAAICPKHKSAHWMATFLELIFDRDVDLEEEMLILDPGLFLAENVANLRAKAART